jgi:hypothetical protein
MRNTAKRGRTLLAVAATLALTGCLDLDLSEEVWVARDGSARLRLESTQRGLPADRKEVFGELEQRLRSTSGCTRVERRVELVGVDGQREVLEADLRGLPGTPVAPNTPTLTREGGVWRFRQVLPAGDTGGEPLDPVALGFVRQVLAGSTFRLTLHAPRIVAAGGAALDAERTTAVWERPLVDVVLSGGRFEADLDGVGPGRCAEVVLALVVAAGLGGLGLLVLRPRVGFRRFALLAGVGLVVLVLAVRRAVA